MYADKNFVSSTLVIQESFKLESISVYTKVKHLKFNGLSIYIYLLILKCQTNEQIQIFRISVKECYANLIEEINL